MRLAFALLVSMILLIGCSEEGSDKYDKGFIRPGDLYDRVDNNDETLPNEYVFESFTIPNKSYTFSDASLGTHAPATDLPAVIFNSSYDDRRHFGFSVKDTNFTLKISCVEVLPLNETAPITIVKDRRLDYNASIKTATSLGQAIVTGTNTDDLDITVEYIPTGCLPSESCSLDVTSGTSTKTYKIFRVTFNRDLGFDFDSVLETAEITINTGDTVYAQYYPLP